MPYKDVERKKEYSRIYYSDNKEKRKEDNRQFKILFPEKHLFCSAKKRAKEKDLDFNIELSDIVIPEYCPVLNIKLEFNKNRPCDNSPSLDRINNNEGYVKGNVRVISYRANSLKRDGSIEEFERIINYIKYSSN